jgi:biopolymer transport protein ExbD
MPLKLNQDEMPQINLTSMIDVVFLLLIFFMVSTQFNSDQNSIAIDLPKVNPAGSNSNLNTTKVVNIFVDGSIEIDSQRMGVADVSRALNGFARSNPQSGALVRPDARLPTQRLMEVVSAIKQSGIARIAVDYQSNLSR